MNARDVEMHRIGDFFCQARKKLGLSQTQMGEMLELHQSSVCRIEKGLQEISLGGFLIITRKLREQGFAWMVLEFMGMEIQHDSGATVGVCDPAGAL